MLYPAPVEPEGLDAVNAGFLGALLRRAAADPGRVLVTLHEGGIDRGLTHAELVGGGRRWAARLREVGAEPGRVVLIALPLSADLFGAFLGALFAGCVPSLMPCPTPKQDRTLFWSSHNALFGRLGGGVMVTTAENRAAVDANITGAALRVAVPEPGPQAGGDAVAVHAWAAADVACLQHSSGTTGLKKGVMLSFAAIDAQVGALAGALGLEGTDVVVSWLPLYHDMGFVACLLLPLATGTPVVMLDPFAWLVDPLALFDLVERHRGTLAWLPNFAFNHLVNAAFDDERRADLATVRAIVDCSEPCKPASLDAFRRRFAPWGLRPDALRTCYAMAETVFAVTQSPPGEAPRVVRVDRAAAEAGGSALPLPPGAAGGVDVVSSGRPLPGVAVAILDADRRPAAEGVTGEIAVRAPFLFAGYHLEPERSARAFHDGAYLTGDLGFTVGDDLFVLGRRDDLLIVLGRNVFAHEIEALLSEVPGLKPGRVLAMGLPNAETGSQDLVVLAEPGTGDAAAARAAARARVEAVLGVTVRRLEFVEPGWLVKSTSGKISRDANRRKYLTARGDA